MWIILILAGVLIAGAIAVFLMPSDEDKNTQTIPESTLTQPGMEPTIQNKSMFADKGFHKSGPNKRICAYMIDLLIITTIQWAVGLFSNIEFNWIIIPAYWLLRDSLNGQSIGKLIIGLQVVNEEGNAISPIEGIIRNITITIPLVNLIEYFVMVRDDQGKRMGDKLAHTKVNDLRPQMNDGIFLFISLCVLVAIIFIIYPNLNKMRVASQQTSEYSGLPESIRILNEKLTLRDSQNRGGEGFIAEYIHTNKT